MQHLLAPIGCRARNLDAAVGYHIHRHGRFARELNDRPCRPVQRRRDPGQRRDRVLVKPRAKADLPQRRDPLVHAHPGSFHATKTARFQRIAAARIAFMALHRR
jgi:hypothetical protein